MSRGSGFHRNDRPDKGNKHLQPVKEHVLATYASGASKTRYDVPRRNNRIKTEISIDEPLNVDWDGNELAFGYSGH